MKGTKLTNANNHLQNKDYIKKISQTNRTPQTLLLVRLDNVWCQNSYKNPSSSKFIQTLLIVARGFFTHLRQFLLPLDKT